jgi:hypothetical protein
LACPFFEPREVLPPGLWTHRPRVPLGEAYSGQCHAGGNPSGEQHYLCNHGYARGICEHFPASSGANPALADAVRFSVISEEPLRLVYILEKDHAPLTHGELAADALATDPIVAAQARAFLASHLRLRERSSQAL